MESPEAQLWAIDAPQTSSCSSSCFEWELPLRYLGAGMSAVQVLGTQDLSVDTAEILQPHLAKDSPHPANTQVFRRVEA